MRLELEAEVVAFLGQVPYEEMPAVYRAGDALVLPSHAEGVPRTVLEAFASGVPVVSSDLEQVAPIVERSGVTVAVGEVAGFAEGIEAMLAEGFFGTLETCHDHGVDAVIRRTRADSVLVSDDPGSELVEIDIEPWDWQDRAVKRLFDIGFAATGLLVLSPVILMIAAAVKLEDGGSVLYGRTALRNSGRRLRCISSGVYCRTETLIIEPPGRGAFELSILLSDSIWSRTPR